MRGYLDIGEVSRETGLTLRALRFYETRGLVSPLRTNGGRRIYSSEDLARLTAAVALKRGGFSLEKIAELLSGQDVDLGKVVAAQLAHINAQCEALAASRQLLLSVKARLDEGQSVDVATICSLIRAGETIMSSADWQPIVDEYFTKEQQDRFRAAMPVAFDQSSYNERWRDLGERIAAALPLDPSCELAQSFVDEWFALLKPFSDAATPEMWGGVTRMYDDRPQWKAQPDVGFGHQVWMFIRSATNARLDAGGTIDGPTWMKSANRREVSIPRQTT